MKSWKTSLAGILGGFLILAGPSMGARLQGDKTQPPVTSNNFILAAAVAAIGILAQDHSDKK